jgi:hypothetical protein
MTLEEEIRRLAVLRQEKDETRKAADKAKLAYDKAHMALWDRMDATGVGNITIDGTLYSFNKPKVHGTVADKSAFYEWAVTEGNAPELFDTEPRQALVSERVRQMIDNGEPLPPGVNFYTEQRVSQRKARS